MRLPHTLVGATLYASVLTSSVLLGQSGPGQYTTPAKDKYLSNTTSTAAQPTLQGITQPAPIWSSGVGSFRQVNLTKSGLPSLTAGQYAMTLTINSMNPFYTRQASAATGVILGKYDVSGNSPVFTPTTVAKNMNPTSGRVFGLMVEPRDGLYTTVDWSAGPVIGYRATRTNNGVDVPFGVPIPLVDSNNASTLGTFVDPAVCYVDGKLTLLYVGTGIEARPLTPTIQNGVLTKCVYGTATTVTVMTGLTAHSPSPVIDIQGNVHGLFLAGFSGSDSDSFFQGSLNSKDAPIKMWDNMRWQNNGGMAGGTFLFRNTADSSAIWRIDGVYMVGSKTPLNGAATMTVFTSTTSALSTVVAATVALSTTTAAPISIPGWVGQFGLGAVIVPFANTTAIDKDEVGRWSQTVPNIPSLRGVRVPVQALAVPVGAKPGLTNTTFLEFF